MAIYARIIMIMMIAVFSAGSVMHAANAAAMNAKMTLAAIDRAVMGDCQNCPDGDDNMPPCDIKGCVSPVLALVPSVEIAIPEAVILKTARVICDMTGRSGPPDPYPPRTITLN